MTNAEKVQNVRAKGLLALFFVSSLSLVPLFTSPLRADDIDPSAVREEAAESRSATFEAVTGAQQEDAPGGPLLVAAYGAVLVLVLGYVLYLGSLTAGASRDLERLERAVEARKPDGQRRAPGEADGRREADAKDG